MLREITHEDFLLLDLAGLLVAQTHADLQRAVAYVASRALHSSTLYFGSSSIEG